MSTPHALAGLQHKKRKGEKLGGRVPYGFRVTKNSTKLIAIKSEQKVIRRILKFTTYLRGTFP